MGPALIHELIQVKDRHLQKRSETGKIMREEMRGREVSVGILSFVRQPVSSLSSAPENHVT